MGNGNINVGLVEVIKEIAKEDTKKTKQHIKKYAPRFVNWIKDEIEYNLREIKDNSKKTWEFLNKQRHIPVKKISKKLYNLATTDISQQIKDCSYNFFRVATLPYSIPTMMGEDLKRTEYLQEHDRYPEEKEMNKSEEFGTGLGLWAFCGQGYLLYKAGGLKYLAGAFVLGNVLDAGYEKIKSTKKRLIEQKKKAL